MFTYYADGRVKKARTRREDRTSPRDGVQYVVLTGKHRLKGKPADLAKDRFETGYVARLNPRRQIFTGVSRYDLLGWGEKHGSLLPKEEYDRMGEVVLGDH